MNMSRSSGPGKLSLDIFDRRVGQPLDLEDGRPPRLLAAALYTISYALVGAVIWAAIAEVREVARTTGELVPVGQIQTVQHFEGGIVDDVLVRAGDEVQLGAPIIRLQPKIVASDMNRLQTRLIWLELEDTRLNAELSGTQPDFSAYETKYSDQVEQQNATYKANVGELKELLAGFEGKIASRKAESSALRNEIAKLEEELATQQDIFKIEAALLDRGHASRRVYLTSKVVLQRATTSLAAAKVRLAEAEKELADAVADKERVVAERTKSSTEQRAKLAQERSELEYQLARYNDQFERLLVKAPVHGLVKFIEPKGKGSVVRSGEVIAEIVPTDERLVAEVKILPRDIGHIKIGDEAELTVTTYDFNIHGKILGKVTNISASSFKDTAGGEPYFRGEIAFDAQQRPSIAELRLIAGMTVEANIITGAKSILRYLLKPIYRSLDVAFAER